ncbi:MAG: signal peptidase II [Myxococcota bacterium]|jgi:signal peptidase II
MDRLLTTIKQHRLFWLTLFVGLVLDLGSKVWAEGNFQPEGWTVGDPTPVHSIIEGFLAWKWAGNLGAAFSMMAGKVVLLASLGIVILAGLIWYAHSLPPTDKLSAVTLGLIGSGAVGNLWDRITFGYVRDFIYFDFDLPFHEAVSFIPRRYPVFNVADIWIIVGAVLLVITVQIEANRQKAAEEALQD